jgi:polyvinyl alcohol dehydrogenase (cytochrome)
MRRRFVGGGVAWACVTAVIYCASFFPTTASASIEDWPGYMFDANHTGFDRSETTITTSTAPGLNVRWSLNVGSKIFAEPVEANGLIYWGSFDGYEHAVDLNGNPVWSTYVGTTSDPTHCRSTLVAGVASTPSARTVTVAGQPTRVLILGGGDAAVYELDALTGAILWRTSLGTSPSHFVWDSPAVYAGNVYVGVSSFLDCPIVPGQMFKLSATTGEIKGTFTVMPGGCTGGGIWSSPVVDQGAGTVYFATGNPNENAPCGTPGGLAPALVELRTSDMSLVDAWVVPEDQQVTDSDFGATPNLFTAGGMPMSGVANKNGRYYAFRRDDLEAGPVWSDQVADGTVDDISPAAVGYSSLLIGGPHTTVGATSCNGSLGGVDPSTGAYRWQLCLGSQVQGAVSMMPGVVVVGVGPRVMAIAASSGKILYRLYDANAGSWFKGRVDMQRRDLRR